MKTPRRFPVWILLFTLFSAHHIGQAATVSGRLLDGIGAGFPNQSVTLRAEGGGDFSTMTDAEGRYSIAVSAGNYLVSVSGYNQTPVNAPSFYALSSSVFTLSADTILDLRLPAKRVSVHVEGQNHNPVAGVQIATAQTYWTDGVDMGSGLTGWGSSQYWLDSGTMTPVTGTDGNATLWLFPGRPGSPYTLSVKAPANSGFASTTVSVEVQGNSDLSVILEFVHQPTTTASIAGARNSQGAYLDSATITLTATAVSGLSVAVTYYTIDGSQTVTYTGPFAITAVGDHAVTFWSIDNAGAYETPKSLTLTVAGGLVAISSLSPPSAQSGGGDFMLTVLGSGFAADAQVLWNLVACGTVRISESELHATILAADIATSEPITVTSVQVLNPPGKYSNPMAFTIVCTAVELVDTKLVQPNETVVVSTAPSEAGKAGIQATLTTTQEGGSRSVTAARYSSNPTAGTFFDVGGGFVDLQVASAASGDSLTAKFYYPSTVTGVTEDNLVLMHFDGSAWVSTLSTGGAAPDKDTGENLEGTVSGGRFAVVFDNTSTPKVTELGGTVFAATVIDGTPPVITCPASKTVECNTSTDPGVTDTAMATDTFDSNPRVAYSDSVLGGTCLGTKVIKRTWTATDRAGNSSSCVQTITVQDTTAPVLSGEGANATIECPATPVFTTPTAKNNCDASSTISFSDVTTPGNCPGTYRVTRTWTAKDCSGNMSLPVSQTIIVRDTTAPTIESVAANPNVLWPPNHKMVPVVVTITASDKCAAAVSKIVSVSCNEPANAPGSGQTSQDWQITGDLTVSLRAERSGSGSGRIYTINVQCTDTSDNTSTGMVTVTVLHDKGK